MQKLGSFRSHFCNQKKAEINNFSWTYQRTDKAEQTATLKFREKGECRVSLHLVPLKRSHWGHILLATLNNFDELLEAGCELAQK